MTPKNISTIIRRLKVRQAPAEREKITNRIIKEIIVTITNIAKRIQRHDYLPERWKYAEVIMLNKAGKDAKFSQNYCPISFLSA